MKLSYFLSTANAGSRNLVAGFDNNREQRKNNNYQSDSGYRIQATSTIIDGANIYPVFNNNSTYVEYLPFAPRASATTSARTRGSSTTPGGSAPTCR